MYKKKKPLQHQNKLLKNKTKTKTDTENLVFERTALLQKTDHGTKMKR
jgi:hypothetical protein